MPADLLDPLFDPKGVPADQLSGLIWDTLELASRQLDHPWRLPVLGTVGEGNARQRIVVLRGVDLPRRQLRAHTDIRSPKVAQLQQRSEASWLFYAPAPRVQLTLAGPVRIHTDDELADTEWSRLPLGPKRDYLSPLPPGSVMPLPGETDSVPLEELPSSDQGRENFAVLAGDVRVMDLLFIRPLEHVRIRLTRPDSCWRSERLVP